jgi:hypothetical protein
MRVTIGRTVGADEARMMVALYRESVAPLAELAAGVQSFSDRELEEQLRNEAVIKLVGRDRDGHPQAFCLTTTDLTVVPWISPAYFARRFPEHHARRSIFYIVTIVVQPDRQGGLWAYALLKDLTRVIAGRHGIAAFDCCRYNQEAVNVPELARRVAGRFCDVDPLEVDTQRFYAYVTSNFRPEAFRGAPEPEIELVTAQEGEEPEVVIDLAALEQPASDDSTADERPRPAPNAGGKA